MFKIIFLFQLHEIQGAAEITPTFWKSIKIKRNKVHKKFFYLKKITYDAVFSNTFKDNIAQVLAVIDDKLLRPFTEAVNGFAGHPGRNGGDVIFKSVWKKNGFICAFYK